MSRPSAPNSHEELRDGSWDHRPLLVRQGVTEQGHPLPIMYPEMPGRSLGHCANEHLVRRVIDDSGALVVLVVEERERGTRVLMMLILLMLLLLMLLLLLRGW